MSFKIQYLCRERKAMRPKMAEIRESQFCLFKFSKTVLPIRRPQERGVDVHGCSRSEEHTSELQSLMRISYAVFCLKKKNKTHANKKTSPQHTILTSTLTS